jgi:spermidine synthase
MSRAVTRLLFGFFFLSGFSSLVYQVVWTRLAFASFGIIAPVLSVVLSVFMLGLGLGSWAGGRFITPLVKKTGFSSIFFYALAEGLIGCSAFAVPSFFGISQHMLSGAGQVDSFSYLLGSALALAVSIFPWCVCMGVTFPFMMAYVRERDSRSTNSFSFLYVANVLGAMTGTFLTAVVLVELLGFHHTLWVAAGSNFLIVIGSIALGSVRGDRSVAASPISSTEPATIATAGAPDRQIALLLFSTGFISMAMEVVWSRGFTGILKTQIYSFALILFTYLTATFVGSLVYRRDVRQRMVRAQGSILFWMAVSALLPIFVIDPRVTVQAFWDKSINFYSAAVLLSSVFPLCALLGYLTPSLIDKYSGGQPQRAGSAYAANVAGCILGPLMACYLLLPHLSTRWSLILLGVPLIGFWVATFGGGFPERLRLRAAVLAVILACCVFSAKDFEEGMAGSTNHAIIRRDYIASVAAIASPDKQLDKALVVNGFGMTALTPITKFISHLPIALHQGRPKNVLVICFGMGTTFRSSLSWGIDTTAVELVPSVPQVFGFYHKDADKYLSDPNGHIVIDDGRRYLSRCGKMFDVITVDPPPPVTAAGSSLLYSRDFYTSAKQHLNPGGIVQVWHMGSDEVTDQAILRSLCASFPYVRCFKSVEGWGMHMLGSMQPIIVPSSEELIARFPAAAQADLVEWDSSQTPTHFMEIVLNNQFDPRKQLNADTSIQVSDDHPMNEYYLLRQMFGRRE